MMDRSGCIAKRHGDWQAYTNHKCRCKDARLSWGRYKHAAKAGTYTSRLVDATGTRRRLQGLAAMGHSYAAIGRLLGVGHNAVRLWTVRPRVNVATAQAVKRVADELVMVVPIGPTVTKTRNHAKRQGWAHLWMWDEDKIDDPRFNLSKRYCPKGHDTHITGRYQGRGHCVVCSLSRKRKAAA